MAQIRRRSFSVAVQAALLEVLDLALLVAGEWLVTVRLGRACSFENSRADRMQEPPAHTGSNVIVLTVSAAVHSCCASWRSTATGSWLLHNFQQIMVLQAGNNTAGSIKQTDIVHQPPDLHRVA